MDFTGYLDFWFTDLPIVERVEKFAALGIKRLDVWTWRLRPMADIYAECQRHGCVINDTFDHELGNLVDAEDHPRMLDNWAETLDLAERYDIRHLFVFSNEVDVRPDGSEWVRPLSRDYSPGQMYINVIDGLGKILELVEKTEVTLWWESLNRFHIQGGVFIYTLAQAADIIRRIDHPRLKLSYDCYHQQRSAGNLVYGLEAYRDLYTTVHIGDVPTRQEPGTGEINYHNIARKLHELDFDGLVGLEFHPSRDEAVVFQEVKEMFLK